MHDLETMWLCNWKSLMRRKGTLRKLRQGEVQDKGMTVSVSEGISKEILKHRRNFRKGYLPVACFGSNEENCRKSLKVYILVTERKPTTYLCNFFLTNTAKKLLKHC